MISSASQRATLSADGGRTARTTWPNPAWITLATTYRTAAGSSVLTISRTDRTTLAGSRPSASQCPSSTALRSARNIVQLAKTGPHSLREAGGARDEVDREFLAPLGDALGRDFVRAPQILARAG
jgi:hypothetical protein